MATDEIFVSGVGATFSPPPEQVANPKKSTNEFSTFCDNSGSNGFATTEYGVGRVTAAPEVVMHIPSDSNALVIEYAVTMIVVFEVALRQIRFIWQARGWMRPTFLYQTGVRTSGKSLLYSEQSPLLDSNHHMTD